MKHLPERSILPGGKDKEVVFLSKIMLMEAIKYVKKDFTIIQKTACAGANPCSAHDGYRDRVLVRMRSQAYHGAIIMRGHKREYPPLTAEQKGLIEDHYKDIKRVRNTLWRNEFHLSFPKVRLDWDDFDSLVNKAVCENIGCWDKGKLAFENFIWIVIQNKARSEIKNQKRQKRASQTYAGPLYKRISDENETELIDLIEGETGVEEKIKSDMVDDIFSNLNKFEKQMTRLLMHGYTESEICEILHCKPRHIKTVKKYKLQSVKIISIARQYIKEGNNNEL